MKEFFLKLAVRCCLTILLVLLPITGVQAAELTQRDWIITLVDALGWSYGLPDEPQDPDYINILSGDRKFLLEAENIYSRETDYVSLMSFKNFGEFSGPGWLQGTREPTDVHLNFNLPIAGEYLVEANIRQPGHIFKINGTTTTVDSENIFTDVEVGTFKLNPGPQEIVVTLPPNGSIDHVTLTAANLVMVAPREGWDPDQPLTWNVINTTLLQLMSLAEIFPASEDKIIIEAENHPQAGAQIVDTPYLGRPQQKEWLRIGSLPASIKIPLKNIESGFYDLSLRAMGSQISVVVGNHYEINFQGKSYLDNFIFPAIYFNGQEKDITVTLSPEGGIDQLSLVKKSFTKDQVSTLLGVNQGEPPTSSDLDKIATLLAAFGVKR